MPWTLDEKFRTPANAAILAFIERESPSAHDEAASALTESARGLSDVHGHCPDTQRYAYFVLHTREQHIFGIAFGMSCVAYALPPDAIPSAVEAGGELDDALGAGWVTWRIGAPARLEHWCKLAHDHALGSGHDSRTRSRRGDPESR